MVVDGQEAEADDEWGLKRNGDKAEAMFTVQRLFWKLRLSTLHTSRHRNYDSFSATHYPISINIK